MKTTLNNSVLWNPYRKSFKRDRSKVYASHRKEGSAIPTIFDTQVVVRYQHFQEIMKHTDLLTIDLRHRLEGVPTLVKSVCETILKAYQGSLLFIDSDAHSRARSEVVKGFRHFDIQEVAKITTQKVLDEIKNRDTIDFIQDYAVPITSRVICTFLGVSFSQIDFLKSHSLVLVDLFEPMLSKKRLNDIGESSKAMHDFFLKQIESKEIAPDNSLITGLLKSDYGRSSKDDLASLLITLFLAGQETAVSLFGSCLINWLKYNVKDQSLVSSLVLESLRTDPPVDILTREAVRDLVFDDMEIKKGDVIQISLNSINKDLPDMPNGDEFDLNRKKHKYVSFGLGVHHCVGANMALVETDTAMNAFFQEFPNVSLVGTPYRRSNLAIPGYESMPIRLMK